MQTQILPSIEESVEIPMSSDQNVYLADTENESIALPDENEFSIDMYNNRSEIEIESEKSDTQSTTLTQIYYSFRIPGIPSLNSTERKSCVCG